MKYLIISDVHLRWKIVNEIIKKEKKNYDKVLFLGDYMDDFGALPNDYIETCKWLKDNLDDENKIFLLGNHDIAYYSSYELTLAEVHYYRCSGYSDNWKRIIQDYLTLDDWKKIKLYYFINDNTLCTHAGLTNQLYTQLKIGNVKEYLDIEGDILLSRIEKNFAPGLLMGVGKSRGGLNEVGGITWCDYIEDFKSVDGLNQIFGHTVLYPDPQYIIYNDGHFDLALDTHNRHYALYNTENNKIIIKNFDI